MSNNRPSAVRTAGTVGRWGMTSFTSTRAIGKISGLESYSSHSNTSYMFNVSAEAQDGEDAQAAVPEVAAPSAPKPRKFFKSRTAAQATAQPTESYVPPQPEDVPPPVVVPEPVAPVSKPTKTKHKKKTAIQEYYVPPAPVQAPPPPQPEPVFIPQPSASQDRIRETIPSKRYLARARKVVNYNEDDSQSQPAPPPPPPPVVQPSAPIIVPISAVSPSMEHPPIVIRISNGTSRLISTDSEEANNASPPHQTFSNPANGLKDNFVAVSPPQVRQTLPKPVTTPSPRKRSRAPVIPAVVVPPVSDAGPRRTTRAIRRQQEEEELRSEQEQTACEEEEGEPIPRPHTPIPGSDNYDLYKTLASSPEEIKEPEEEEQQQIPESVEVIPEPPPVVVPNVQTKVPAKRGRKKKADIVVESVTPVVQAPVSPEVVAPVVPETVSPPPKPAPARRGRKPKAVAIATAPVVVDEPPAAKEMGTPKKPEVAEEPQSPSVRRSTRGGGQVTPVKLQKMDSEMKVATLPTPEASPVVVSPPKAETKPPVKSYARKRKAAVEPVAAAEKPPESSPQKGKKFNGNVPEKIKNDPIEQAMTPTVNEVTEEDKGEVDKPTMKLVISKKKGSIFKSRALVSEEEVAKNRPVYKHKWDVAEEDRNSPKGASPGGDSLQSKTKAAAFDGDFDETEPKTSSTVFKRRLLGNSYGAGGGNSSKANSGGEREKKQSWKKHTSFEEEDDDDFGTPKKQRNAFYTVKQAHQIQENGEFQEMDDEVEYILDTLQPKYPILTRCLSAIQLSTKCMSPEFRMHVRAHGTVTQFFSALQDAPKDRSLGLCTATIMFVLAQDNIGMDLDKDSLQLMLNLLECDVTESSEGEQTFVKNRMKVRKLCEEIKALGKAPHLNLDNITVGTLAMETLLSLTSKRAGEWFKEELRNLGGLEHIVKTICECCRQISDYVAVWTEGLLEKLRKIERCLRVLENVMVMNEQNQNYILTYDDGNAINILVKLYKLCDTEIALYPTTLVTPKDDPGVVIREALVPTLKVLICLTHPFNDKALGAMIVGEKAGIFDTSLHLLLDSSNYVPDDCIFELSLLVLSLLINLTTYTVPNRTKIMEANALSDFGSQFAKVPAIKALVEFFYKCEESARRAEENADALLDSKPKKEKNRKGEEFEETVTKIYEKAGNHMEHTIMASYVTVLMGHLVSQNEENRAKISVFLRPDAGFGFMAKILEKYYNFMNLTASSEAIAVAQIESTKKIIDCLTQCDGK